MSSTYNVSHYLMDRLKEQGVDHLFGVPGDFVLGVFHSIEQRNIRCICTCNELNAAYAADAYARIRGLGALLTTYVVGELSAINGVAGAYAERVPVVQITGCPATRHYQNRPLLHHTLGDYMIPVKMYEPITAAASLLVDAAAAPAEIDRVLQACLLRKLPVYLGIPADIAVAPCSPPSGKLVIPARPLTDPAVLEEAVAEVAEMLRAASKPVVVVDGEIARFGLEKDVLALLQASGLPFATMMLGKTVLDEHHPQFIGLYEGDRSREYVRMRVEEADCVLMLGCLMTDFNSGGFTAHVDESKLVAVNVDRVQVKRHFYERLNVSEFLGKLASRVVKREAAGLDMRHASEACRYRASQTYQAEPGKKLSLDRFFARVSRFLDDKSVMIVETGSALFAGAEVLQPSGCKFMSQTFFGSIGYTVGATLGTALAAPDRRACLFVGDGSFQVTATDLSTMIRYKTNPIIFLLNNDGYLVERVISDGPFNDLQMWQYARLPEVFGGGWGCRVETEDQLEDALQQADARPGELVFVEVVLDKWDSPESMTRAGAAMARNNHLEALNLHPVGAASG
ncbi:MAG: thiamine pyrophosphate-binding protein [Candidatus Eremiobacterota bacterium]